MQSKTSIVAIAALVALISPEGTNAVNVATAVESALTRSNKPTKQVN